MRSTRGSWSWLTEKNLRKWKGRWKRKDCWWGTWPQFLLLSEISMRLSRSQRSLAQENTKTATDGQHSSDSQMTTCLTSTSWLAKSNSGFTNHLVWTRWQSWLRMESHSRLLSTGGALSTFRWPCTGSDRVGSLPLQLLITIYASMEMESGKLSRFRSQKTNWTR